ncbi:tripartite-type tricarboxylate transporter receptor subunit TctC [Variovorax paradoxus]|jgi:tripartite-type tricarboxylate transporter receptor subunit TctC|uniref:Tripartite-type tricarboxylate transporter receptor subunit TctC n=1 Tax=Variovorax paradoxus TaxID=34073 RepID=A0AAW8EPB8_VARPD|nr:tripartite tricarboxylate transporter substrate binding protein [Variovorax paradoxus]MDP9974820.1 tripartite-type tricarboxylate transporter receptor subunit TctC [Variovorax paradoxus]MDQ0027614.1 tripartite-type tricarboxylate transporter receptor subunit TctC [Variovorax paradoxus]
MPKHCNTTPSASPALLGRRLLLALASVCTLMTAGPANAADPFPVRPITLILPFPAGGVSDGQLRALAAAASKDLGQPIIIVNRPGNGGTLAPAAMARSSAPDGYTIALAVRTLLRLPHLSKVNYDPLHDFTYIIGLSGFSFGIIVRDDAPWKTLKDMLDDARARPGAIAYGATGRGSSGHVAMERLARAAGVRLNFVPYKGTAEVTNDLLGGHIGVYSDAGWGGVLESGRVRVLATMGETRPKRWPQVPTLKELGYDIVVTSPIGLIGPRGMDPAIVARLHDALRKAMNDPAYVRAMDQNDQIPEYLGSEAYAQSAAREFAREKVLMQELGITLE